jgi:glycosyltransferase involved in cell wall biosynthesis
MGERRRDGTGDAGRPLVSVIIPVRDMGRYLGEALRSVLAQDYRPIEVIVVDDGSTDDSAEVAASFAEVICLREPRRGVSIARNLGIARSRGAFIAFQDADDIWDPSKLTVQMEWMLDHPETGYVAAFYRNFLEPGMARPAWVREEQLDNALKGGISNLVVRRSVFETIGVFDPDEDFGADVDWIVRAKDAKIGAEILPDVLVSRRIHAANMSHQWKGGKELLLKALKASIDRRRGAGDD